MTMKLVVWCDMLVAGTQEDRQTCAAVVHHSGQVPEGHTTTPLTVWGWRGVLGVLWVYAKNLVPVGGLTAVVEGGRVSTAPSSWGIVVEGVAGVEGEGGEEVEESGEGVEDVTSDEDVGKDGAGEGGFIFSRNFSPHCTIEGDHSA